jgi:oleate hydratase
MLDHESKAYLVGGGIGSLAAAAFMIRDGNLPGKNIHILEACSLLGGSLDASGDATSGYSMRGGRMFTTDNYECTWDLFKSIPSLSGNGLSVYEETLAFSDEFKSHSRARLVDKRRAKVPVTSMGFSMSDRVELLKITNASEDQLGNSRITDWLSPSFFETNFWYMWSTTFAFEPWHSAVEFRRYLHRFMLEFSRIETLAGVKRTVYNQYDSLVRPLNKWLEDRDVNFSLNTWVSALDHSVIDGKFVVTRIHYEKDGHTQSYLVNETDLVVLQNASMTDDSSLGSMTSAPAKYDVSHSQGWCLWENLAADRPQFGNPRVFRSCIAQSCWESFTVTLKTPAFFDEMRRFSGNQPGTGGLVTFKDSNWLMSVVLPHQPHFLNQPSNVQVFWGYGLYPDRIGNFIAKPMDACSGAELLQELCGHLRFDAQIVAAAICIPCRMPYITSMFMPRNRQDRPLPVPVDSKNLAFVSQFVEIADDVVFTVEYSVRAAQMAVYSLLGIEREIPPVTPHDNAFSTRFEVLLKAFE